MQTNSTIVNFLVDYDDAKSVVIYGNGVVLACQNMQPPFPDFPGYSLPFTTMSHFSDSCVLLKPIDNPFEVCMAYTYRCDSAG